MKNTLAIAIVLSITASHSALANEQSQTSPEALAAHFMSQFYDVPANTVKVTLKELPAKQVEAVATTMNGHTCTMGMAQEPISPSSPGRWLVSSMKCAKGKS